MTAKVLLERLKSWDVYKEDGSIETLDLSDTQLEIPEENFSGLGDRTISITLGYDVQRNIVMLIPSGKDGRLE